GGSAYPKETRRTGRELVMRCLNDRPAASVHDRSWTKSNAAQCYDHEGDVGDGSAHRGTFPRIDPRIGRPLIDGSGRATALISPFARKRRASLRLDPQDIA